MNKRTETKLWSCDNCGRRHWGFYEERSQGWEFPSVWEFVATTRAGDVRRYASGPFYDGWAPCLGADG